MAPKKKGQSRVSGAAVSLQNNNARNSRAVANNAMVKGVANRGIAKKPKAKRAPAKKVAKIIKTNTIAKKGSGGKESARKRTDQKVVAKKAKRVVAKRNEAQQDTTKKGSFQSVVVKKSAAKREPKKAIIQETVANKAAAKNPNAKSEVTKKAIAKERLTKKAPTENTVAIVEPKKPIATKEQQQQLKNLLVDLNMNALYKTKGKRPAQWMQEEAKRFNANGRTVDQITDIDELIQYGRGLLAKTAVEPIPTMPISLCKDCNGVDIQAKPPQEFANFFGECVKEVRVECPICLERCKLPMVTECGHVFCTDCLRLMFQAACFKCPICQRMIYPTACCMLK